VTATTEWFDSLDDLIGAPPAEVRTWGRA
jgi:hypothetical protein